MPTPNASTFVGLNVELKSFVASTNDILDALRAQIVAQQSLKALLENQGNDIANTGNSGVHDDYPSNLSS